MPAYSYECPDCHNIIDRITPIGEASRTTDCVCGGHANIRIGIGVQVAPSALENKGESVREINSRERHWNVDMPAYKRMRNKGMQPNHIDGSAVLENQVGSQFDVQYKRLLDQGITRERIRESEEQAREITEDAGLTWNAPG